VLYASICVVALALSERMIFLPPPATYRDGDRITKLRTADGVRLSAVYLPNPGARYTLLHSHGNAEDLGALGPVLTRLRDSGFAVLAYDYRGYGTSEGRPSERGAYGDIEAAYRHLSDTLGVAPDRIVAYGRSVGSGPAVDLAVRHPVAGLVIESGFTTAFRVLTRWPLLPVDRFRNIDKISRVRCPVLVLHGGADDIVPIAHGRALWTAAREPKRFVAVDGAGHNDLWIAGANRILQALAEFGDLLAARAPRAG
jgi:fermentation-respiration switch protein FrsA (DUF1100 family)